MTLRLLAVALIGICVLSPLAAHAGSGGCNPATNPHSFACADATFRGQIFPIANNMSLNVLSGEWALLTYSAVGERPGPEFTVGVNPQDPNIPEGVFNRTDGSRAGGFDFASPGRLRFANWGRAGFPLLELSGHTQLRDSETLETVLGNGRDLEAFQCRIFLRVQHDHLLCRWFSIVNGKTFWRGYLGFLRSN